MRPCERCDFIGPDLPTVVRDERDVHRAMHEFTDALLDALRIPALVDWLARVLDRAMTRRP